MWLQDFLPEDAPNCRIFIYGYESNIFGERTHPRFDLAEQAENLIQALDGVRNTHKARPEPQHNPNLLLTAYSCKRSQSSLLPTASGAWCSLGYVCNFLYPTTVTR